MKLDLIKNAAPIFFAFIVCAMLFFCVYYMLTTSFPAENKDPLNNLIQVLITIFTLQMNFFFGSSASSKAKDETISDFVKDTPQASSNQPINIEQVDATITTGPKREL